MSCRLAVIRKPAACAAPIVCRIAVHRPQDGDLVVVLSVIDNLVKGASGQAVQNLNILFGLDERLGLSHAGMLP